MTPADESGRVLVLGGAVMDLIFQVHNFPSELMPVQAKSFSYSPGGKGLNEAVMSSRLGAKTILVSAVGKGAFGGAIKRVLNAEHVHYRGSVQEFEEQGNVDVTGVAAILHLPNASPCFIGWKSVSESRVTAGYVRSHAKLFEKVDIVLMNLEVSPSAATEAIGVAHRAGARVIFHPSPPFDTDAIVDNSLIEGPDLIVGGAEDLTSLLPEADPLPSRQLLSRLFLAGVKRALLIYPDLCSTVGDQASQDFHPGFTVVPMDSAGSGDAFCGALAAFLAGGVPESEAVLRAAAAGAFSLAHHGAYRSLPSRSQLESVVRASRRTPHTSSDHK